MKEFKKITDDFYYNILEKNDNINNFLVDKISNNLIGLQVDFQTEIEQSLINCESPIEQLLSLYFEEINLKNIYKFNPFIDIIEIEKQKELKYNNKKYRVDFFIPVIYKNQGYKCFIIECDGYEFHQKNKEQVEKDNIKTRDLQKLGYEIIKFSGTEIWNRPNKCVYDVLNIILSHCKYITKEEKNGSKENV